MMDDFTNYNTIIFRKIQGLTTLMAQQQAKFDALVSSFINDIGVIGPLITELIQDQDSTTHVFDGFYVVFLSNFEEFFINLTSWVEGIINESNEVK